MNVAISALDRLDSLKRALNDALPQTQCTRCGYPDCEAYAEAIAKDAAPINRCPPGGAQGIERLAAISGLPFTPLDPVNGVEAPRLLAVIDEAWCIGCTLCLKACPTDAILGGSKAMHTVIDAECTGCELCLPACPVDCISLVPVTGERTGWNAWSVPQAQVARERYEWHVERLQRDTDAQAQPEPAPVRGKRSVIDAAMARARAARQT
jgi:Na+-translocating ferredoxin:NAD+ oxidoreductase subunit B